MCILIGECSGELRSKWSSVPDSAEVPPTTPQHNFTLLSNATCTQESLQQLVKCVGLAGCCGSGQTPSAGVVIKCVHLLHTAGRAL